MSLLVVSDFEQKPGKILQIAIGVGLLLVSSLCGADRVDPFVATVEVEDGSEAARREGFNRALSQVLIKLSGREDLVRPLNPGPADPYVQQFRYLEAPAAGDSEPPELDAGRQILEVRFHPDAVQRIRSESGLPIWPLERGETIVWAAVEERGRRRLLGTEPDDGPLLSALRETAEQRAMPVVIPLFDLEDQSRITVSEIWGGFAGSVREASQRYAAEHLLIGRIQPSGPWWLGRWVLEIGSETLRWEDRGDTREVVLESGIRGAATRLATRMGAWPESTRGDVSLQVSGVESPAAYGRVTRYLRSLSLVNLLTLEKVERDTVHFRIDSVGDTEALEQVLTLDDLLQRESNASPGVLRYSLNERAMPR